MTHTVARTGDAASLSVRQPAVQRIDGSVADAPAVDVPVVIPQTPQTTTRCMFVSSNGGHLAQLMALKGWWSQRQRIWVSFDKTDARSRLAGEDVVWAHFPTTRNLPNLLRNSVLAFRTLRSYRPDVIVSTGAGLALPFFVFGRLLGIPTIFIEVYDRVDSRTLTGRLCRPFATKFLVQWPEQQRFYRGSTVIGPLL